jgi:hypothetical protein
MLFVGIDHSLTAFGLAAVSPDWGLDFRKVRRVTLTTSPEHGPEVARRALLARDVATWVSNVATASGCPLSAVRVFIEGGVFMRGKSNTIRSQERLAAAVEHELYTQHQIQVAVAQQRAVRTLFMGSSLSGGRGAGDAAQGLLRAVAPDVAGWDEAELDAFLVANWALSEAAETFVSVAPERAA